jgi:hypothetical protein
VETFCKSGRVNSGKPNKKMPAAMC